VWGFPSFLAAGVALLLGAIFYWKRNDEPTFFPFVLVMAVVAWIHGWNGISVLIEHDPIMWMKLIVLGELVLPVMVGYVGYSLVQNYSSNPDGIGSGWWRIMAGGTVILGALVMHLPGGFMQVNHAGEIVFNRLGGVTLWGFITVALFLGMLRLEQILRSFRDPLRYRLKYVLVGLGGLTCISMAQAIYLLLVTVRQQDFVWAGGVAALSSLLLMGFGLVRWRVHNFKEKVQISHQALYTSLTVLCVGGYLVLVGMVTAVIQQTGWEIKEALGGVIVFLACLGLVLVMLSRQTRTEFQRMVARHVFRAKYDYREKWLEVTETFTPCKEIQQIWNRYLAWLSRTFGHSRVTIWKHFPIDGRYHQIRKERRRRKWAEKDHAMATRDPLPIPETHPIISHMKTQQGPVLIQEGMAPVDDWGAWLHVTQTHVCVPLLTGDARLLGFCTLSQESPDEGYDQDDLDLLRAIAHHVTMLLIQFELVEERNSAAKWEAVHRFSAFYLHDLKNLASSLSMVAQNADQYGHNPEFQVSAMRTVRNTSQRIMEVMRELANQAKEPTLNEGSVVQAVDVNLLVQETLSAVMSAGCEPTFHRGREVPMLHLKAESIKQVLLNLIMNARQATEECGTITIATAYDGDQVIIEIADTGVGMSASQLEHLFQPFQSTKPHGLGVGLFQCKRIVEDHHGAIHVESEEGRGTTVIITFPVTNADNSRAVVSEVSRAGAGYEPGRNG
jgi:putative PEP-CTERM system histidine kinase